MKLSDAILSFVILMLSCAISGFFTITYQLNTFYELLIVTVSYFAIFIPAIKYKYRAS